MIGIFKPKKLGIKVKNARKRKNISQSKLGELVGLSQSAISAIERGITENMPINKLYEISKVLDVTLDSLLIDSLNKYKRRQNNFYEQKLLETIDLLDKDDLRILEIIVDNLHIYQSAINNPKNNNK